MDEVFKALADPSRRRLLDSLNTRNGQTLRELCAGLDMARQSVSKHLAVLEGAGLVTTARRGREKFHYLDAAPINAIADRWMSRYDRERARALADLKTALEQSPMTVSDPASPNDSMNDSVSRKDPVSRNDFVYTTYIRTTPERLWQALTDPAFTRRYWGVAFETDWRPGSTIIWHEESATVADADQVVLEADPGRRLSYTWHTFTPEWAQAVGVDEETRARLLTEPRSKVTFEIEPAGELVKLTVVHEAGDVLLGMSRDGWPVILSGLKTLLETGEPLPAPA